MSARTNIRKVLFPLLLTSFFFIGCDKNKKEGDGWENCTECTMASWVGEYAGSGDYSNYNNNTQLQNLEVSIIIEETADDYLTIYMSVPNTYSTTVSGDFSGSYIISFAGSGSSITATMFMKEGELKLTGNSKKFHYKVDSLIIDQVVTFETFKDQ